MKEFLAFLICIQLFFIKRQNDHMAAKVSAFVPVNLSRIFQK